MEEMKQNLSPMKVVPEKYVMKEFWLSAAEEWLSYLKDNIASPMQLGILQAYYRAWADEIDMDAAYNFWKMSEDIITVYSLNMGVERNSPFVPVEIKEAFSKSTCFLGYYNMAGLGVTSNNGNALSWFMKSLNVPNREAYNALYQIYREGIGVQIDCCKAFSYLRTCCELGLGKGVDYFNMALCLQDGWGVDENIDAAFKCMEMAAGMNHPGALEYLISSSLNSTDISGGLDKVVEYINQYSSLISE